MKKNNPLNPIDNLLAENTLYLCTFGLALNFVGLSFYGLVFLAIGAYGGKLRLQNEMQRLKQTLQATNPIAVVTNVLKEAGTINQPVNQAVKVITSAVSASATLTQNILPTAKVMTGNLQEGTRAVVNRATKLLIPMAAPLFKLQIPLQSLSQSIRNLTTTDSLPTAMIVPKENQAAVIKHSDDLAEEPMNPAPLSLAGYQPVQVRQRQTYPILNVLLKLTTSSLRLIFGPIINLNENNTPKLSAAPLLAITAPNPPAPTAPKPSSFTHSEKEKTEEAEQEPLLPRRSYRLAQLPIQNLPPEHNKALTFQYPLMRAATLKPPVPEPAPVKTPSFSQRLMTMLRLSLHF